MFDHNPNSAPLRAVPQGSYIVLRVSDIEKSAEFYRLLGLVLTEERHGEGPIHYNFPLAPGIVCELYPLRTGAGAASTARLGFMVDDAPGVRESLSREGYILLPGTSSDSFVTRDPNGNEVEISQRAHPHRGT